jgi:hypothetical protein
VALSAQCFSQWIWSPSRSLPLRRLPLPNEGVGAAGAVVAPVRHAVVAGAGVAQLQLQRVRAAASAHSPTSRAVAQVAQVRESDRRRVVAKHWAPPLPAAAAVVMVAAEEGKVEASDAWAVRCNSGPRRASAPHW